MIFFVFYFISSVEAIVLGIAQFSCFFAIFGAAFHRLPRSAARPAKSEAVTKIYLVIV